MTTIPAHALEAALESGDLAAMIDTVIRQARMSGKREIIAQGERRLTGSTLAERIERTAHAFSRRGMRPGDVILFGVRPGINALVLLMAAMRNGGVVTVFDPGAGNELFARRLELLRPSWVIAESLLYAASARTPLSIYLRRAGLELPRLSKVPGQHVRAGRRVPGLVPRSVALQKLQQELPDISGALPLTIEPDAPSLVVFTSGTTGMPKGVQHTGRSITAAMQMMLEGFELAADSVVYTHNLHSLALGALKAIRCVVAPIAFTPKKFLREVKVYGVTHAFLLPVEAWKVALHCERTGQRLPESLRHLFLFSAPITTTVLERVHALGNDDLTITCAYAMTEMIPVAWIDSREKLAWSGDGDVVGRPVRGVEARVVGGELELRGPNAFLGYVGMEHVDWYGTGDNAYIDDEGRIVLMGRAKDMLIHDHFNLYPGLYEPTISRINGIGACAIIGVPDPETADERILLYVEPDPAVLGLTSDELRKRVQRGIRTGDTRIDVKALPDEIHVVEQLPRSGRSHKIDRAALRVQATKRHHDAR